MDSGLAIAFLAEMLAGAFMVAVVVHLFVRRPTAWTLLGSSCAPVTAVVIFEFRDIFGSGFASWSMQIFALSLLAAFLGATMGALITWGGKTIAVRAFDLGRGR